MFPEWKRQHTILEYPGVSIFRETLASKACILLKHVCSKGQNEGEIEEIHRGLLFNRFIFAQRGRKYHPTLPAVGKPCLPSQSPCFPPHLLCLPSKTRRAAFLPLHILKWLYGSYSVCGWDAGHITGLDHLSNSKTQKGGQLWPNERLKREKFRRHLGGSVS